MSKPKKIKDAVRLSVVLPQIQANHLQRMAIKMSAQEGRQITVSEAIRMAIEALFPMPKQMDLFK